MNNTKNKLKTNHQKNNKIFQKNKNYNFIKNDIVKKKELLF